MQENPEAAAAPTKSLAEMKAPRDLATMPDQKIDMFSQRGFALAQRIAQAFATSDAVPAIFQAVVPKKVKGEIVGWVENAAAFGNCLVAIETAQAVGMSITAVMQNANIIEGKLSWSGKFIIAAVNASRRFTPLRFDIQETGKIKATYKEKDGWNNEKKKYNMVEHTIELENIVWCAWALPYGMEFPKGVTTLQQAKDAGLPVIIGPRVSMRLAVEEGWYAKPGSKWQTEMRDLMGMYRAGAYFGNIHAPDVVMGMGRSTEEAQDMTTIDVEQQPNGQYAAANLDEMRAAAKDAREDKHPNAETVEATEVVDKQPEDTTAPIGSDNAADNQPADAERPAKEVLTPEVSQAYESVATAIAKAGNLDALADAADLIKTVLNQSLRGTLTDMYRKRYAEFNQNGTEQAKPEPAAPTRRAKRGAGAAPE